MARSRRGRNEGSIVERAPGLWEGKISLGLDENGKRRRPSVFGPTKAEVLRLLAEARVAAGLGYGAPSKLTVGEYMDLWLSTVVVRTTKYKTHKSYAYCAEKYIKPHIGHVLMSKLRPTHMDLFQAALARAEVPEATAFYCCVILKIMTRTAAGKEVIASNPFQSIKLHKPKAKKMKTWTMEEALKFFSAAATRGDRLWAFYVLAVLTGLRHGELLGLRWSDVDLVDGSLSVSNTLQEVSTPEGTKFSLDPAKSDASVATIRLPAAAIAALKKHREARFKEGRVSEFVFTTRNGNHYLQSNVNRAFHISRKAAGVDEEGRDLVKKIRIHDLRHTCATLLLEAGEGIEAISAQLRHEDPTITAKLYAHVTDRMRQATADRMDAVVRGAK